MLSTEKTITEFTMREKCLVFNNYIIIIYYYNYDYYYYNNNNNRNYVYNFSNKYI